MQESKINRQVPQSELRKKLDMRLKERGIKRSFERSLGYNAYDYDYEEEKTGLVGILGTGLCWALCIFLATFIYANTFLNNNFSQAIVSKTESYINGSKDIDTYWENFRGWVNDIRRDRQQRKD